MFDDSRSGSQNGASATLTMRVDSDRVPQEWIGVRTDYPRNKCIHTLFEEVAERWPRVIALQDEKCQLTYSQLNEQANQLAHYLRKRKAGPEVVIGVCLERSIGMIVAFLGILKAGAAYLPLDSRYPPGRIAFMMADANVPFIITERSLLGHLPRNHTGIPLCVENIREDIAEESRANPSQQVCATGLANIMYTSGSTGTPKGVMVTHRAVVRLVRDTNYLDVSPDDVFLQLAPTSFDASTFEIWAPLLNGAQLVMAPPQVPSLEEIGGVIRRRGVTTLWLAAGLFHLMVEQRLSDLQPIRRLLVGGDVVSPPHAYKVLRAYPECELINGYGPTENTTFTCCHRIVGDDQPGDTIPIGRPIANTRVYILDALLRPVPAGAVGELFAAGDGLARGYLNRPELTADKFVRDPCSDDPDARLYRTGDLARYRSDGAIEFVGRTDHQVKIAGNRIELGEIEAALGAHPTIGMGVVTVREELPGEKKLVAYLVSSNGSALSPKALREYLQEKVPAFMIPSTFVWLESLPLSPNGKVDRGLLPMPEAPPLSETPATARNRTEGAIAEVWRSVLHNPQIGMEDNFFDLGGDSLQLIEIHAKLQELWGAEVSITDLFEYTTIGSLAAHVNVPPRDEPSFSETQLRASKQRAAMERQKQRKAIGAL